MAALSPFRIAPGALVFGRKGRRLAAVSAAGVLAGATFVGAAVFGDDAATPAKLKLGWAEGRFPDDSAQAWVTYADHLVSFTVRSERDRMIPHDNPDEGMVGRVLRVDVSPPLWSRSGAPTAPTSAEFAAMGWVLHDGARTEFAARGAPRLEVGETYVAPFVRLANGAWIPLTGDAIIPVRKGILGHGERKGGLGEHSVAAQVDGQRLAEFVRTLERTGPDPFAAGVKTADPEKRARIIAKRRSAAT